MKPTKQAWSLPLALASMLLVSSCDKLSLLQDKLSHLQIDGAGPPVHLDSVKYTLLPPAIQRQLDEVWDQGGGNCTYNKTRIEDQIAYTLDINADFKSDFLWQPPCAAADGDYPAQLWVSKDDGSFTLVRIWNSSALLKSDDDFMFTDWCGGTHANPAEGLAVLDNRDPKIVPFGKCYDNIDRALSAARKRGYNIVAY